MNKEYEQARDRLHDALLNMREDNIAAWVSFLALVDLVVEWAIQNGGKPVLWDAVARMHERFDECSQFQQETSAWQGTVH